MTRGSGLKAAAAALGMRGAGVAIVLGLVAGCGNKDAAKAPPPPPVTVLTVQTSTMPLRVEYVGETAGFRDVEVRARVSGILLKRTYTEGETVQAGQVLFEIDPAPYQAAVDQARGGLAQVQAAFNKAKADRERVVPLLARNVISRRDYDDTIAAYDAAAANVQSARARLKEAELNLDYTRVTAPIGGVTSRGAQSEGSLISASGDSGLLTTISQFDPLYANFSYSEQDWLKVERMLRDGTLKMAADYEWPVHIRLADGSEYPLVGHMNFSDNRVDSRTGTIRARAIFANKDERLLPGQFVRVILDLGVMHDVLQVPERAIVQSQADKTLLLVGPDDVVQARTVQVGYASGGMVQIKSGLGAGDRVIVEGVLKARPGAKVSPTGAPAASAAAPAAK